MSIIGIQGVAVDLPGTSAAAADSSAHRAYRAAVKDLHEAQKKLTDDAANKTATEILEADRMAVQMAQAALADAAAALAREAERTKAAQAATTETTAPSNVTETTAAQNRIRTRANAVDLYA